MKRLYHVSLKGANVSFCIEATHFIICQSLDKRFQIMKFYNEDVFTGMVYVNEVEYVSYFTDLFCYNFAYVSVPFPECGKYE